MILPRRCRVSRRLPDSIQQVPATTAIENLALQAFGIVEDFKIGFDELPRLALAFDA